MLYEKIKTYLLETEVLGIFSEALSANVETVLSDKTVTIAAHLAAS